MCGSRSLRWMAGMLFLFLVGLAEAACYDPLLFEKHLSPEQSLVIGQIQVSGNETTRLQVILKELPFRSGDTIASDELMRLVELGRQNLLKTSLFNFVYVNTQSDSLSTVDVSIRVEERWYWWVFPIIEPADRNVASFFGNGNWDMMNYGAYVQRDNFRGRQEMLKFRLRVGYANQLAVLFQSPEYKRKTGWGMAVNYNVFDHLPVFTLNDQPVYYKNAGNAVHRYFNASMYLQYRPQLTVRHTLELNVFSHRVSDTILALNANFFPHQHSWFDYLTLTYSLGRDVRDSKPYPLSGNYQNFRLTKAGLGVYEGEPDFWTARLRINNYWPLKKRFYSSIETMGEVSSQTDLPYVVKSGLGYRDFLRGYEYYVVDGSITAMAKANLLFELLPTRVAYWNFIPTPKFSKIHYAIYLRGFIDNGYVVKQNAHPLNRMVNSHQYGCGLGVDFVTFYDKVFSFNYAVNRFGEHGFYFHLNLLLE